eukprot:SAG31_NODE_11915_length_986_cov_1.510710_2_plen_78_part_00
MRFTVKPTLVTICVLVLMTVAVSRTYSKADLMDKSVPDLVKIMREKEIDEDEIDLVCSRVSVLTQLKAHSLSIFARC